MKTCCPKCENSHLYHLKDSRAECSSCGLRFSPKKIHQSYQYLNVFIQHYSTKDAALSCGASLPTIQSYFNLFRTLLPSFLEQIYQKNSATYREYEEYLFLPNSKRKKKQFLIQGIGIMALYGKGGVYTLLLPEHWKNLEPNIKENPDFIQTLANYYQWNKIVRIDSKTTPIGEFWHFLENFMKPYHGVREEYFGLYLKEAEFRFNYNKEKQAHHMMCLWKRHLKQKFMKQEQQLLQA